MDSSVEDAASDDSGERPELDAEEDSERPSSEGEPDSEEEDNNISSSEWSYAVEAAMGVLGNLFNPPAPPESEVSLAELKQEISELRKDIAELKQIMTVLLRRVPATQP